MRDTNSTIVYHMDRILQMAYRRKEREVGVW